MTIAKMPALIASGNSGQAATTAAKSGLATPLCGIAILVAIGTRSDAGEFGSVRDEPQGSAGLV